MCFHAYVFVRACVLVYVLWCHAVRCLLWKGTWVSFHQSDNSAMLGDAAACATDDTGQKGRVGRDPTTHTYMYTIVYYT